MRRLKRVKVVTAILLLSGLATGLSAQPVAADTNISPSLVITQLKVTSNNGQFVMLYNATDTVLDMSKYQLEYFNSYDLTKATSSKLIALAGSLPPHGYYLVNDSQMSLCYQLVINSMSLGFSSTAGFVEILAVSQANPGGTTSTTVQDYVGWSKTAVSGAQTLPSNTSGLLLRQPQDTQNNPNIISSGSGTWLTVQPDIANQCNFVSIASPIIKITNLVAKLLPATQPPVVFLPALVSEVPDIAINSGLMTPLVNEILPNPIGSGNDATDEFIEIYNPNQTAFDLSGYGLQAGTTSLHNFIFLSGSSLAPQSFSTFYSSKTGLSLTNSGGQVKLLDPAGNSISVSDVYGASKDGQSWALANGNWSWTAVITPGAINMISPQILPATAAIESSIIPSLATAAVSNTKTITQPLSSSTSKTVSKVVSPTPIHNWTLALVAVAAILYGAYEYRADLGNRIHQLKEYIRSRRANRSPFTWWRSHRTNQ